ncbi:YraN family protein [Patescibacteria group bacterium]|nr:YraN family protein [Patescibacteria group bacterium]
MDPRRIFGNKSEQRAARFLKSKGLRIITRQYRTRFGEIDIIARQGKEIVFVEVKARKTNEFGYPEEAVNKNKIKKIIEAGFFYLQETKQENVPWRIDVIAVDAYNDIKHLTNISYE